MTARNPVRRSVPAKELAKQFGVSVRTVQRTIAEPRDQFIQRAAARRTRAVELRLQGKSYKEIADDLECSTSAAGRLLFDARKQGEMPTQASD